MTRVNRVTLAQKAPLDNKAELVLQADQALLVLREKLVLLVSPDQLEETDYLVDLVFLDLQDQLANLVKMETKENLDLLAKKDSKEPKGPWVLLVPLEPEEHQATKELWEHLVTRALEEKWAVKVQKERMDQMVSQDPMVLLDLKAFLDLLALKENKEITVFSDHLVPLVNQENLDQSVPREEMVFLVHLDLKDLRVSRENQDHQVCKVPQAKMESTA